MALGEESPGSDLLSSAKGIFNQKLRSLLDFAQRTWTRRDWMQVLWNEVERGVVSRLICTLMSRRAAKGEPSGWICGLQLMQDASEVEFGGPAERWKGSFLSSF